MKIFLTEETLVSLGSIPSSTFFRPLRPESFAARVLTRIISAHYSGIQELLSASFDSPIITGTEVFDWAEPPPHPQFSRALPLRPGVLHSDNIERSPSATSSSACSNTNSLRHERETHPMPPGYFDREAANLLTKFHRRKPIARKSCLKSSPKPLWPKHCRTFGETQPFPVSQLVEISNVEENHHSKATAHFVGTPAKSDVLSQ